MNKLVAITRSDKQVFNVQDLGVIWGYSDERKLLELIKYYTRKGEIFTLARGLYSFSNYSESELRENDVLLNQIANKLVPNSYVSLYTVLVRKGVIHQYYDAIFSIANRKVTKVVKGIRFEYQKIKDSVLFNDWGIVTHKGGRVASVERAVLDSKYLYPKWGIEDLELVDKKLLTEGEKIYAKY